MMGHVGDAQGVIDPARFKADGLEGLIFGRRDKDIFPFQDVDFRDKRTVLAPIHKDRGGFGQSFFPGDIHLFDLTASVHPDQHLIQLQIALQLVRVV